MNRREMSTMFADTLLIVFISVCTALLAEGESSWFFLTCDQTPREGKDPRPRVPRASKGEVTSLASFGGGGDASHVLYFRESYLQECERIQCGIHCQVSPVQGRFHLRVCGDNFESCHGCFG